MKIKGKPKASLEDRRVNHSALYKEFRKWAKDNGTLAFYTEMSRRYAENKDKSFSELYSAAQARRAADKKVELARNWYYARTGVNPSDAFLSKLLYKVGEVPSLGVKFEPGSARSKLNPPPAQAFAGFPTSVENLWEDKGPVLPGQGMLRKRVPLEEARILTNTGPDRRTRGPKR